MNYVNFSREQLLSRIEELEVLNHQLLLEKEQETRLEYAWTYNLGQWFFNVKTNNVTFNPLKAIALGYAKEEIPESVPYQFFTDLLHPEDYEKTMQLMLDHLYGKASVYEAEYRIKGKDGKYRWYYDRGRITQYDENGKPLFLAGIVFNITEKREMEEDLEKKNQKLTELSTIDELTKVANRRKIMNQLQYALEDPDRNQKALSIAIFDLDNFKQVNDSMGHVVGDSVLADAAQIIKQTIRAGDSVGRYGGEEFLVLFPNTDLENAAKGSERIRRAIEAHNFINGLKVTISGGVKQYEGEEAKEFIHFADKKLYEAKNRGKNLIVF